MRLAWRDSMPAAALNALCGFRNELELVRHSAELGKRAGLHLPHQAAAVHLHGCFRDADVAGDLLGDAALRDLGHDLAFARSQRFETRLDRSNGLFLFPPLTITSK